MVSHFSTALALGLICNTLCYNPGDMEEATSITDYFELTGEEGDTDDDVVTICDEHNNVLIIHEEVPVNHDSDFQIDDDNERDGDNVEKPTFYVGDEESEKIIIH